jgi:rubrerythrin
MKNFNVFLAETTINRPEFINLIEQTGKVHGEMQEKLKPEGPIWGEKFYTLDKSTAWKVLEDQVKNSILISLGKKILQEAYYIESAGMAYSGKMILTSRTKQERQFYCFVAEEEARHLRLLETLGEFKTGPLEVPSFAALIGEIIQESSRMSHFLLIQVLLEGWGLDYYKELSQKAQHENVARAFKQILKDEIRHHSAGVILFSESSEMSEVEFSEFIKFLERICAMIKIGPYSVCEELFSHNQNTDFKMVRNFLVETGALPQTVKKLKLIKELLGKVLLEKEMKILDSKQIFEPMDIDSMASFLFQSIPGTSLHHPVH